MAWRLHKPTIDREREAANPPPLRDTLDESGANRLASSMLDGFETTGFAAASDFMKYLLFQLGKTEFPTTKDWIQTRRTESVERHSVRGYVQHACWNSDTLAALLEWHAHYLMDSAGDRLDTLVTEHNAGDINYINSDLEDTIDRCIAAVNACLAHESVVFRMERDSEHGFAARRIGSDLLRQQVIVPALRLLRDCKIIEPLQEYEAALTAWARGQRRDAVRQASHAVESTMKAILTDLGIPYKPSANPSALIKHIINDARIFPAEYENFWEQLSHGIQGVITVRSKTPGAGHGPGPAEEEIDNATAEYSISMAGANIVFLLSRWTDKKNSTNG